MTIEISAFGDVKSSGTKPKAEQVPKMPAINQEQRPADNIKTWQDSAPQIISLPPDERPPSHQIVVSFAQ